jgi:flagellar assembly protein FliH
VAQGFQYLADSEEIKLRLNPLDYEILQQGSRDSWPAGVELVADGTIEAGGFLLETPTGDIDGTLENRWAVVSQVVRDAIQVADETQSAD